jgi:hypothetical protein
MTIADGAKASCPGSIHSPGGSSSCHNPFDLTSPAAAQRQIPGGVWRTVIGLLPLWILLTWAIVSPRSLDSLAANPPAIAGLPAGLLFIGIALTVMGIGFVAIRKASSMRAILLAFVGLTIPSTAVVAMSPAIILLIQVLAT